jgi:hypothetical protein
MTDEERRNEICEIVKLVDQVVALAHHHVADVHGIRVVLARLENRLEKIEAVEGMASAPG